MALERAPQRDWDTFLQPERTQGQMIVVYVWSLQAEFRLESLLNQSGKENLALKVSWASAHHKKTIHVSAQLRALPKETVSHLQRGLLHLRWFPCRGQQSPRKSWGCTQIEMGRKRSSCYTLREVAWVFLGNLGGSHKAQYGKSTLNIC